MCSWIDRHGVRVRSANLTKCTQGIAVEHVGGERARLRGHIEPAPRRIPRQHIRIVRHFDVLGHPHRAKVHDLKISVALAGNECKTVRLIEREAMRSVGTRKIVPRDDPLAHRIYRHQLIAGLNGDENAVRNGVIMRVACLSSQIDRRAFPCRLWIDDDVCLTRLVRNEHFVRAGRVRNAVWKPDPAYTRCDLERPVIDDRHFVVPCRRDVDLMMRWHGPYAGGARHIHYLSSHIPMVGIEDDRAPGVHVVHVDAPARRVDTLVIESVRWSG